MELTEKYADYNRILASRLNEKRYEHSIQVALEAKRLAEKYGADAEKAYLAGLLHDITKNSPDEEHLNIFSTFGIILTDIERNAKKLWHAVSGAAYVRYVLNITDPEIIDAIRYHTTAKPDISLLSKLIYLADFTAVGRDYDDVDIIRELVDRSLDEAYIYSLTYTVRELVDGGKAVHPDTINAYNQAILNKNREEN